MSRAVERGTAVYQRGRLWIENADPASRTGATVGWVRRYQAADGQLFAVLLAAYVFLTLLPLLLLESTYVYDNPHALADRVVHRLTLEGATADLLRTVLVGAGGHKLSAVLIAAVNLFFFGLGLGRVLQIAHARSWGIDLRKSVIADQSRYLAVLGALAVLTLLFVVQAHALQGHPWWIAWLLDVGWLAVLLAFFVWAPWLLLHKRIPWRDVLPGAVFTLLGLVALRLVSVLLLAHWLEWYSKTYGSLGIVMAIFFWLVLFGTVLVLAAALSPALAHRRDLRRAR
ncbi:MAG TPA: YhjD/YihY/BrkB family envelope integrity protein [Gaiellaceae bacterium]|nr:YhjD/YihY/BrkB family envelope integrity protein [Gaiellaceae bacterium]